MSFFCWSCGVKLGACASMAGKAGHCPECGEAVIAPETKGQPKKLPAIQYLREEGEDGTVTGPPEKPPLQVDVYVENERSQNILPGLLPKKIGDIVLPAFIVIRRKPWWVTGSLMALALSPLLWLTVFYFPEVTTAFSTFQEFRQRQLDFVENVLRSSAVAQAEMDRKARNANSRQERPKARPARLASEVQTTSPPPKPASPPERQVAASSSNGSSSLASPAPSKPPASYSSPYNPPPPEPYKPGLEAASPQESREKEDWPQMVLRNNAMFTGHSPMRAAFSFLVEGERFSTWLVTSARLLGPEGGVTPPVVPDKLGEDLVLWRAYFPGDPNSFVDAVGGPGMVKAADTNWLALKIPAANGLLPATPLKLRHNPPAVGELLYLVGLQADDRTGASQHLYSGRVSASEQQDPSLFGLNLDTPFQLNGFTGAPVVDLRGELVGVLTGGRTSLLICTKAGRLEALLRGK